MSQSEEDKEWEHAKIIVEIMNDILNKPDFSRDFNTMSLEKYNRWKDECISKYPNPDTLKLYHWALKIIYHNQFIL